MLSGISDCARLLSAMDADKVKAYARELQSQPPTYPKGSATSQSWELRGKMMFVQEWQTSRVTAQIIATIPKSSLISLLGFRRPAQEQITLGPSELPTALIQEVRNKYALTAGQWSINVRPSYVPTRIVTLSISLNVPGNSDEVSMGSFSLGPLRPSDSASSADYARFRPMTQATESNWTLEGLVSSIIGPKTVVAVVPSHSLTFSETPSQKAPRLAPFFARASYRTRQCAFDQQIDYVSATADTMLVQIDDPLGIANWPVWSPLCDNAICLFSPNLTDIEYKAVCSRLSESELDVFDNVDLVAGGLSEITRDRLKFARIFKWLFAHQTASTRFPRVELTSTPEKLTKAIYRLQNETKPISIWPIHDRKFHSTDLPRFSVDFSCRTVDGVMTMSALLHNNRSYTTKEIATVSLTSSEHK